MRNISTVQRADAADLGEVVDDGLRRTCGGSRASEGTVPSRVLAARSRRARVLLCGEAGGAELRCGAVEDLLRGGVDGSEGGERLEAFDEAGVDGGGGFAVELLVDDGLGEGLEGG